MDSVQSRARWCTPAKVFERSPSRRFKGLGGKPSSKSCESCPQAGKEEGCRVADPRSKPVQAFSWRFFQRHPTGLGIDDDIILVSPQVSTRKFSHRNVLVSQLILLFRCTAIEAHSHRTHSDRVQILALYTRPVSMRSAAINLSVRMVFQVDNKRCSYLHL